MHIPTFSFKKLLTAGLVLSLCLMLAGCDEQRSTVSMEDFVKVVTIESMVETDFSEMTDAYEGVTDSYGAELVGGNLSAVYMAFESAEAAAAAYQALYDSLDPGASGTKISMDGENYHSVTVNKDYAIYTRVIQVEDMMIMVRGLQTYKTEIDKIISEFGSYPVTAV